MQKSIRILITGLTLIFAFGCTKSKEEPKNSLTYSMIGNLKGLDPAISSDEFMNRVNAHIFEALYQYHYLKRPLELVPLLADGMPQISKDGLTYTIKIKKGVMFQDDPAFKATNGKGREVTAEDFIYSWRRLADPKSQSDGFWIFDEKIKGFNAWKDASKTTADYSAPIEGLQAPDKHTLVIKLTRPYFQLLYVLAMNYTAVVPREAVDHYGAEFLNHPVGTGPFMLKEWIRNSRATLKKNPTFRGESYPSEGEPGDAEKGLLADAGKTMPFLDEVTFNEIPEDQPRWLKFMKGEADFANPPKDNFDQLIANDELKPEFKDKGFWLQKVPELNVVYDVLNQEDAFLGKHKLVRQAMSLAIDRPTLIKKLYSGRGIVAHGPVPPGIDSYDPNFKSPYAEFNVEKAKELLKKAGFPDGKGIPELNYETTNSATSRQFAEFRQQALAAIGIKIKINVNTWPEMMEKNKKKKAQMFGMAWGADYPDAENFMQLFFGPNEAPGPNSSNFKNKEFDELYKKAALLPPGPERTKIYHRMRDIVVEEVPWIFWIHRLVYMTSHGWVHNFKYQDLIDIKAKYIRVDSQKRVEMKKKL